MTDLKNVVRYTGSALALGGLLLATTFVGVRTTEPVAATFIEVTIWRQAVGVLAGLLLFGVGLGVARVAMPEAEKGS